MSTYTNTLGSWFSEVPSNWKVSKLKRHCKFKTGSTPSTETLTFYAEDGFPWLRPEDIIEGRMFAKASKFLSESGVEEISVQRKLSTVLCGIGTIGKAALSKVPFASNQQLIAIDSTLHDYYCYFLCLAAREELENLATGNVLKILNTERLGGLDIPLPDSFTQAKIAAYLNRETAKIDRLIAKQKRLIELLQEKRQAVISRAVTKGLDPNVRMKDSGVEWLGEVPEHWKVLCIKHIVSTPITDGPHETPQSVDEGVPFISAEAISSGTLNFEKRWGFISQEDHSRYSKKYCPRLHDIYMVKSGATTGVTAIVETEQTFNIWSPLAVIRCVEFMNPYFVLSFMRSRNFLDAVSLNWSFGTQQNIGMGVLENLQIPVPPLEEQESLVRYIYGHIEEVYNLVDRAKSSVELLKERRQALISAAVTGKIDVRNLVSDEEVAVLERVSESELNIDEATGDEE